MHFSGCICIFLGGVYAFLGCMYALESGVRMCAALIDFSREFIQRPVPGPAPSGYKRSACQHFACFCLSFEPFERAALR